MAHGVEVVPAPATLANPVMGHQQVAGTDHLVVVQGVHHGDAQPVQGQDQRGGDLVVDVVQVGDLGLFASHQLPDSAHRFPTVDAAGTLAHLLPEVEPPVVVDLAHEVAGEGRLQIARMMHRERNHGVAAIDQALADVEVVALRVRSSVRAVALDILGEDLPPLLLGGLPPTVGTSITSLS